MSDAELNRLYEGGCLDGDFGMQVGEMFADFDRPTPSFEHAVLSAIDDIESTIPGLRVRALEAQSLMPVTISEIARRTGLTREAVRLLADGKRGPGDFPPPDAVIGKHRFWTWGDVAQWFNRARPGRIRLADNSRFERMLNDALELRELRLSAAPGERRAIGELVRRLKLGAA